MKSHLLEIYYVAFLESTYTNQIQWLAIVLIQ